MFSHHATKLSSLLSTLEENSRGVIALLIAVGISLAPATAAESFAVRSLGPQPGDVYREYAVHNNADNWRVTDPDATAPGAKKFLPNPIIKLDIKDLDGAVRADALLDRWGGHLKTTDKRIRFNGQAWLRVPEISTMPAGHRPEMYYSQDNPIIDVPIEHLRAGDNTIEGTCSTIDDYGWGQWGMYSLILRVYYDPAKTPHPMANIVEPASGATIGDDPTIVVESDSSSGVKRVDVIARYNGYDEDGDGIFDDWHETYFQPTRGAAAELHEHVGTARLAPHRLSWDTHWVPDQEPEAIQLVARVQDANSLWYVSPVVNKLTLNRDRVSVKMYQTHGLPEQFAVRVGREKGCVLPIPPTDEPKAAAEAVLALRTWHGWDGSHHPLRLNDVEMPIRGKNHHYDFDLLPVSPSILRSGDNLFQIRSDTEHHMLEVLWPGPALLVRHER